MTPKEIVLFHPVRWDNFLACELVHMFFYAIAVFVVHTGHWICWGDTYNTMFENHSFMKYLVKKQYAVGTAVWDLCAWTDCPEGQAVPIMHPVPPRLVGYSSLKGALCYFIDNQSSENSLELQNIPNADFLLLKEEPRRWWTIWKFY